MHPPFCVHFVPLAIALALVLGVYRLLKWSKAPEKAVSHVPTPNAKKSIYHANKEKRVDPNFVPDPKPLLDFDLRTAKTRDYLYVNRTLRYPYYQTMAQQFLEIENWIELSSEYEWCLSEKKRVIEEQGTAVLDSLPENDPGCQELLETIIDWMPKRYPTLFNRLLNPPSNSDGILNHTTGERYEWAIGEAPVGTAALRIISRLTECDFLMAREREDGHVYCVGGLAAFPGFYLLSEKIGKSMLEVHKPVPQFNEKLLVSVERTLKRMLPSVPFERSSWEIVDDMNLFWHNISSLHSGGKVTVDPGDLILRIDRQAFRKLPKTKTIIFAVHPLTRPLHTLAKSPLLPALLHKIHTESSQDLITYKIAPAYWEALKPWLEARTREQIEQGLIGEEDLDNVADFRKFAKDERV